MQTGLKTTNQGREVWLDIIRGICAVFVIIAHVPSSPVIYGIFYAPIMIPAFFFVSGYLGKNYDGSIGKFLYYRVLKLFIAYIIILFLYNLLSVSTILSIINEPAEFIQFLIDYLNDLFLGYKLWFIPALIFVSVYFIIINKICSNKPLPMFIASAIIAAIGLYIGKPDKFILWHSQTAMICLLFYTAGYCVKQKQWLNKFKFTAKSCILTAILYFGSVIAFSLIFGAENIFIIAANNEWKILPVTATMIFLGVLFIICLSKKLSSCKLLSYIGTHSLLYFAFSSQCIDIFQKVVNSLYDITRLSFLNNVYITCLPLTLCAVLLMLIPCKLSDKFCPALNGKINLPTLKTKDKK